MALKEHGGQYNGLSGDLYHKIHNITGLQFGENAHCYVRKQVFSSEEFRAEHPDKPLEIMMEDFQVSKEAADQIKTILYGELKKKSVINGKDEGGADIIVKQYENMIDS